MPRIPGPMHPPCSSKPRRGSRPLDVLLARETYLDAWLAATVAGRTARPGGTLLDVSSLPCPRRRHRTEPRPCDLLLDALGDERDAAIAGRRPRACSGPCARSSTSKLPDDEVLKWGMVASLTAMGLWDMESWDILSARQIELARASGALGPLVVTLKGHAVMLALRGDFEAVGALVAEETALAEVTGVRLASFAGLLVAGVSRSAGRGGRTVLRDERRLTRRLGTGSVGQPRFSNNGLGRYPEACEGAELAATSQDGPFTPTWALPELVEAAVRSGRRGTRSEALEQLDAATLDDSDWAMGVLARSRALLSDGCGCRIAASRRR